MSIEDDFSAFRRIAGEEMFKLGEEIASLRAHAERVGQANDRLVVENAALRNDKDRLDWILTDDGGFWVNWMYDIDEWTPELKASRDAIDACLKPSTWKEAQP